MRKALFILALAVLSFVSCSKENPNKLDEVTETPLTNIVFNLTANHPNGSTKAVKTGWENGDVIFVFFNNIAAPRYLKMSYDGSSWNYAQMNGTTEESLDLVENATGTMRAVYLPFGNTLTVANNGTSFTFSQITYSYYLTATLDYTVTGGMVSGAFDMEIPVGYIQFFLDDASASSSTEIELREPHLTPQGIESIAADGTITHTNIAHGAPLPGYVYDKTIKETGESKGYLFSGVLASGARNVATTYHFTLVKDGWTGTYYSKSFEDKSFYRGESEGRALKLPALENWTIVTDYKPIDLGCDVTYRGVTKRIYWCSCNIGSLSPEGYGDYYAWGETEPKDKYDWLTYKWCNGSGNTLTRYNGDEYSGIVDGKGSFSDYNYIDDAARQTLGLNWRTPTRSEWIALGSSRWQWVTINTINGCLVTSRKEGFIDRSIFIPAAGRRLGSIRDYEGTGMYWSSDSRGGEDNDEAYDIYFYDDEPRCNTDSDSRSWGLSIRPVTE